MNERSCGPAQAVRSMGQPVGPGRDRSLIERSRGTRTRAMVIGRCGRPGRVGQATPSRRRMIAVPGMGVDHAVLAVGQVAVVTDAVEAVGQDVKQEAADELVGIERHHLALVVVTIVLPQEADPSFVQADQATVGDRDAMGIAAEIVQDLFGPAEWALGEDHPGRRPRKSRRYRRASTFTGRKKPGRQPIQRVP